MSYLKISLAAGFALTALFMGAAAVLAGDLGSNPIMVGGAYDDSSKAIEERSGSGDPVAGIRKSFLCQGCHGTEGISHETLIPKLAGQYADYIRKQIHNYQSGARSHPIMNAMAGTVDSEKDLADIAAYFASQAKMEGNGLANNPLGESIFLHPDLIKNRPPCVGCHGVRGKGVAPTTSMYPVIGGQHKDYIREELMDFRSGKRTNSPNGIMNKIAGTLSDKEIEAVADYISAQ